MWKNSIRQMLRMPVRTFSFFALIMAAGFMLSLAAGMFMKTTANMKEYQKAFKTIGTVSQKASSMKSKFVWDAELKDYRIVQDPEYDEIISVNALDFEGANYIEYPEKRNYYASYSPEYDTVFKHARYVGSPLYDPIVEFSPVEDCVPDQAVRILVTKVLFGYISFEHSTLWFCDHHTKDPEMLYHDKTYVAALNECRSAHGELTEREIPEKKRRITLEYEPFPLHTNSYDGSGNSLKQTEEAIAPYYEVSDDFYNSRAGKKYLNYAKGVEMRYHSFPVTGTNATELLLPFYNDNAYISQGRDISEEAYGEGIAECLVSEAFARNNRLQVGDRVTTNLFFTNGKNAASYNYHPDGCGIFDFTMLTDEESYPEVFETKEYTIVGIYASTGFGFNDSGTQMASDEMIVPLRSIVQTEKNILEYGPMNELTTSFQIPNGSVDAYREKWERLGLDDIEISFYDKGYSKLEKGMKNMRFMSVIFGAVGVVLGVVLLIFYSRMFIGGQKVRITIERCMGLTVPECRCSLLWGAMLVLAVGSLTGCILGVLSAGTISIYDMGKELYDTTYTVGHVMDMEEQGMQAGSVATVLMTGIVCELMMLTAGWCILHKDIHAFLKSEPLYLIENLHDK